MAGPVVKSMPGTDVVTLPSLIGLPVAFWPLLRPQPSPAVAGVLPTRPSPAAGADEPVDAAVVPGAADVAVAAEVAGASVATGAAVVAVGAAVPLDLSLLPHADRSI